MKKILVSALVFSVGAAYAAKSTGYSPSLLHVLEQLRHSVGMMIVLDEDGKAQPQKPFIGGFEVGMRGSPGEFFLLIPYFRNQARVSDVQLMLKDKSPVVRIMAAYLIKTDDGELQNLSLDSLANDKTVLEVAAGGCVIEELTVAEMTKRIKENHDYFGESWNQRYLAEELIRKGEANSGGSASPQREAEPQLKVNRQVGAGPAR